MQHSLIVLLSFLLFACNKPEQRSLGDNWKGLQNEGKGTALRNGEAWASSAYGQKGEIIPESFGFGLYTYDRIDSVLTETLGFENIPIHPGLYQVTTLKAPLYDNFSSLYAQRFDDQPNAVFTPIELKNNWIKVESADTITGTIIVRGTFDVYYQIKEKYKESGYPSKVRFSNGVFEVMLK